MQFYRKYSIITFIFLLFLFFRADDISAQKIKLNPVSSLKEFDYSVSLNLKYKSKGFDILNDFSSSDETIQYFESALDWAKRNGSIEKIIVAKQNILAIYIHLKNDIEAIARIKDLLEYDELYETSVIRDLYYLLKEFYKTIGQFNDEYFEILSNYHFYSKKYGYLNKEESYNGELAFIHYKLKNYSKAIVSYKEYAKELFEAKQFFQQSSIVNNIGLCFAKEQQSDSAKFYYKKALDIIDTYVYKEKNSGAYDRHFVNVIESNIASLEFKGERVEKALPYYYKELKSAKRFDEKHIVVSAYYNIADVFYQKKKPTITRVYLDSIFTILNGYTNAPIEQKSLLLNAKSLLILGKFKEANSSFLRYEYLVDSIETQKTQKKFLLNTVEFETNQKTKALEESRLKIKEEGKTITYQWIGISFLVLSLVGFIFFNLRIRKKNRVIGSQKNKLDIALQEKQTLLKEIHHRVKNNLQVVSGLLTTHSKNKGVVNFDEVIAKSQHQIRSMSLVHEMLYQKDDISKIPAEEYIKKLGGSLINVYSQKKIDYHVHAGGIEMHIDYANPLGLILTELITNSLKHAFKDDDTGTIEVTISERKGAFYFTYADDGIGLSSQEKKYEKSKFGNRLVSYLAEEINATIEIKNKTLNNRGLIYIFVFPHNIN